MVDFDRGRNFCIRNARSNTILDPVPTEALLQVHQAWVWAWDGMRTRRRRCGYRPGLEETGLGRFDGGSANN